MIDWRLKAYERWLQMVEPDWANVDYPKPKFNEIYYYSAPKQKPELNSLDEVDPKLLETYKKLGIPLREQEVLAGAVSYTHLDVYKRQALTTIANATK